jgi:uncharacterized membrane protein YhaH (DUF805 family)
MTLWRKLFGAAGRIRRRDYWLLSIGSSVTIAILDIVASLFLGRSEDGFAPGNPVSWLLWFISLWIGIALMLKRLHDRNKGPVWIIVYMIAIVGWIWCVVELGFLDGTPGPNRYGLSPKGIATTQAELAATFE